MRWKASFTIEAVLLLPEVLCVIFFLIFLGFYEHDRAVIAEKTFRCVRERTFGRTEDDACLTQMQQECVSAKAIQMQTNAGSITWTAETKGSIRFPFLHQTMVIREKFSGTGCYAPEMIRKALGLIEIKNTVTE